MSARWKFGAVVVAVAAIALAIGARGAVRRPEATPATAVATGLPRLLDLGAGKCIPCKAMAPILEQLRADYAGKLQVEFIDVWRDRDAAERHRVGMIPTQIFFAPDGRELWRHEGFLAREEILAKWKELGFAFR